MVLNKALKIGVSLIALFASHVFAADSMSEVSVMSIAKKSTLGVEFRGEMIYDDHMGMKHGDADDPGKTTTFHPQELVLVLEGDITDSVSYFIRYDMIENQTREANLTWWMMDNVGMTLGVDRINYGGFEQKNYDHTTIMLSDYHSNSKIARGFPHNPSVVVTDPTTGAVDISEYESRLAPGTEVTLAFHYKMMGMITAQFFNDKVAIPDPGGNGAYAAAEQPGMIFEWVGDFNGVSPLIQYGVYDLAHSSFYTVGLAYNANNVNLELDYTGETYEYPDPADDTKDISDEMTNITLNVSYNMGDMEPFLGFAQYENKQGGTDSKVNTYNPLNITNPNTYDDNSQKILIGSYLFQQGTKFRPYFAYMMHSGEFLKNPLGGTDEKETTTNSTVHLGIAGKF